VALTEHRVCWILAYIAVFVATRPVPGQLSFDSIAHQQEIPQQQARDTAFSARVSLVSTPVTIRDSEGEMVPHLEESNFRIYDNGVPQRILHLDLGGDPISLVTLIETSSRVEPLLPQVRKTGILLTQMVMGLTGEAAIVSFSDSVDVIQSFTTDSDSIEQAVTQLKTGTSSSKLCDAMALGLEVFSSRPQPTTNQPGRRRVLLILSEAMDVGSDAKLGAVLQQAALTNVTIYSVGLSTIRAQLQEKSRDVSVQRSPPGTFPQPPMPGTVQTRETEATRYGSGDLTAVVRWAVTHVADQVGGNPLEVATAGTGGAHFATSQDRSMENAIAEVGGELHSQYTISYSPTDSDTVGYHEIKVQVDRADLKVRARPGYYLAPQSH
jgi:VWFA-related protein